MGYNEGWDLYSEGRPSAEPPPTHGPKTERRQLQDEINTDTKDNAEWQYRKRQKRRWRRRSGQLELKKWRKLMGEAGAEGDQVVG